MPRGFSESQACEADSVTSQLDKAIWVLCLVTEDEKVRSGPIDSPLSLTASSRSPWARAVWKKYVCCFLAPCPMERDNAGDGARAWALTAETSFPALAKWAGWEGLSGGPNEDMVRVRRQTGSLD